MDNKMKYQLVGLVVGAVAGYYLIYNASLQLLCSCMGGLFNSMCVCAGNDVIGIPTDERTWQMLCVGAGAVFGYFLGPKVKARL